MVEKNFGRRSFLKAVGAGAASLALPTPSPGNVKSEEQVNRRPNVLIIHTDQLSSWALSAYARNVQRTPNYGKILVETPHIDSLAKEGALLYNFFTNSAVCTPSRGCLLTGRYPHAHGAYRNNIEMNRDEVTLAQILNRHGYDTGYAGKWHLDGEPKPGWLKPERSMGFTDCRFMFNRGHWKKIVEPSAGSPEVSPYKVIGDEKTYTTDWLTDKTIEFIKKPRRRPFFYMVSIPDPHTPFTVREPYMSMYDPDDMIVPNTFKESPLDKKAKRRGNSIEALKRNKARYCGLVKCIDDNVGRILQCLKVQRLLDQTIIVFTTDHGEYMGEHGLYGKNQWYRTAYQIPCLIRWPEKIKAGTTISHFVTNVDIQQTLLGLMEVEASGREQGRDASPLLRGEKIGWKDEAMIHHSSLESAGIFTSEYELVLRASGKHMLFSRLQDPEQTRNLHGNPEYTNIMKELTERVIRHNIKVDAPAVSWLTQQAQRLTR
jgi:arylsulfatase A-like enzyme